MHIVLEGPINKPDPVYWSSSGLCEPGSGVEALAFSYEYEVILRLPVFVSMNRMNNWSGCVLPGIYFRGMHCPVFCFLIVHRSQIHNKICNVCMYM